MIDESEDLCGIQEVVLSCDLPLEVVHQLADGVPVQKW